MDIQCDGTESPRERSWEYDILRLKNKQELKLQIEESHSYWYTSEDGEESAACRGSAP